MINVLFCWRQGNVYLLLSSEKYQLFYTVIILRRLNPVPNITSHFLVLFARIILSAKRRFNLSLQIPTELFHIFATGNYLFMKTIYSIYEFELGE